jgi:hypothetical protein
MSREKHPHQNDTQPTPRTKKMPKNEAPASPAAPANQRHSDQGKMQQTYESQKTEGMRSTDDRVTRGKK